MTGGVILMVALMGTVATSAAKPPTDSRKTAPSVEKQISAILSAQSSAWNRGDIDGFMEHYWKSDRLSFSSGGKTTRGWADTKSNYKRRYPTRDTMGTVSFSDLDIAPTGDSAALVLGRWRLLRKRDPVGGNFSLLFRRIAGRWLIVHDHTSRDTMDAAPAGDVRIEGNVAFLGEGRKEELDLYLPDEANTRKRFPAVVIIHGGGWFAGDKGARRERNIGVTLARSGYVCASINYRLAAKKETNFAQHLEAVWPGNLHDCKTAVRFLRKYADRYHIDPRHIGAIGGSAGGHLTAVLV